MNYLGHIYLSGDNDLLIVGNFIGDYVKGNKYLNFPEEIQQGILFHREIDNFTDTNPNWISIREMIKPLYNRYSGVVADLFVDHFLAANWDHYSSTSLPWFAKKIHAIFLQNYKYLPEKVQGFLAWLIQHKRFESYACINGIRESLFIMSLRSSLPDNSQKATELLHCHYDEFQSHAKNFMADAIQFAQVKNPANFKIPEKFGQNNILTKNDTDCTYTKIKQKCINEPLQCGIDHADWSAFHSAL
ncbi:MAG: DUF479 domain-containing protein [Prolixibacteraceae bacterium]|nr:DUF479 domain-containing protein [Prolixibacteraceae bacterium]